MPARSGMPVFNPLTKRWGDPSFKPARMTTCMSDPFGSRAAQANVLVEASLLLARDGSP